MKAYKLQTSIYKDGELHLTNLPCKKSDQVEVIGLAKENPSEEERLEALRRFREHADAVSFRSERPYPSRDELHERH